MSIPDGWPGLIGFLVFLAPGAAYNSVTARRRPRGKTTGLEEFAQVVAVSLTAWVVPALVVVLPRVQYDWWFAPFVRASEASGGRGFVDEPLGVALGLGLVALTLALAAVAAVVATRGTRAAIRAGTPTWGVLRRDVPPGSRPYVWVTTSDGLTVAGWYRAGDLEDHSDASRDLVLAGPFRRVDADGSETADALTHRILLRGDAIVRFSVQYLTWSPVSNGRPRLRDRFRGATRGWREG